MTALPPVGVVLSNCWLIKRRASSASGEAIFLLSCIGCGRSFNASEKHLSTLGPCAACAASDTDTDKPPTRLPLNLKGWREI
jgi:hypothetical protein